MTKLQEIIEKELDSLEILSLSKETNFIKRTGGKIQAFGFVLSFFQVLQMNQEVSLNNWSTALSFLIKDTVSKQAISQKFYDRHVEFVEQLLKKKMSEKTSHLVRQSEPEDGLLDNFNRAFVRDSTCITLDDSLAERFPSSYRKTGAGATARIQAVYDLKAKAYQDFKLASYRDTDAKEALNAFDYVKQGDLLIEDLGYQSFGNYQALIKAGVDLVTKWKYRTVLFKANSTERIDLLELLKAKGDIDMNVMMGVEHKVSVRIVAHKLPKKVAEKRKREARKNRHSKAKHSKDYYKYLEWEIIITTVSINIWSAKQVSRAYRIRWHIEIIFKAWKSKLNIDKIVAHKMNPNQCKIILFLTLLYVFLRCAKLFQFFYRKVKEQYKDKQISLLKFYDFIQTFQQQIIQCQSLGLLLKIVVKHACYDKRKDRYNHEQLIHL